MQCNKLQLTQVLYLFITEVISFRISIFFNVILSLHSIYLLTLVTIYFANSDNSLLIGYYSCLQTVLWTLRTGKDAKSEQKYIFKMYSFHRHQDSTTTNNDYCDKCWILAPIIDLSLIFNCHNLHSQVAHSGTTNRYIYWSSPLNLSIF